MAARKGVVLETGEKWTIVLFPDGEYKKIRTGAYKEVGEIYEEKSLTLKYAVAAAIFLAVILTSFDYYSVQAYAQVSPHMELGVNRWGRVVTVEAKDDNGQLLLDKVEMKNDKIEVAAEKIFIQTLEDEIELNEKPEPSVVTTANNKKVLEQEILDKIDNGRQKAIEAKKQNLELKKQNNQEKKEVRSEVKKDNKPKSKNEGTGNNKNEPKVPNN